MPEYIKREEVLAQIEAKQKSIEAAVNCNYRAALTEVHKIVSSIPSSEVIEVSGEIKTNYNLIRNKSVEELAECIYSHDDELNDKICKTMHNECPFGEAVEPKNCINCVKQWLESEVDIE